MKNSQFHIPLIILSFLLIICFNTTNADVITLKNGQTIEGVTKDIGSSIEVRTRSTRMVIPESQIENIEVKKYDLQTDSGDELTPEEMRRKKSEEFFKKAQMEFDRMNVARGIELLEKAVEADPLFEKGLERLIIHLVKRNEYQKAHKYIEELSKIKPLPPEFEEIKKKVSEVIDKEREK